MLKISLHIKHDLLETHREYLGPFVFRRFRIYAQRLKESLISPIVLSVILWKTEKNETNFHNFSFQILHNYVNLYWKKTVLVMTFHTVLYNFQFTYGR
jgi:hypothetical protein